MSTAPESLQAETPVAAEAVADDTTTEHYAGLASRLIGFVIDAAFINIVAIVAEVGAVLVLSLFHDPHKIKTLLIAIGGAVYTLWTVGYFIVFWSTTGQTPGMRLMQIRVLTADRRQLKPTKSLLRCGCAVLAALPLFAGYLMILFDSKRRALQDRMMKTVVIESTSLSAAAQARARRRAATDNSRPPKSAAKH
jgi:uncharacterized RDD family membrane protein YckC